MPCSPGPIRRLVLVTVAVAAATLLPAAADASHISGIRITQTGNTGLEIDVDITAFYTTGSTESTAYLGTYYNAVPAADWGDGSTLPRYGYGPSTGLPLVATSTVVNGIPARAYRGSFSHTYGAPGNYTIEANTRCCPLTTPTYTLVTGSIVTTTVTTTGVFGPTTFTTSFVRNTLAVAAAAPAFDKAFAPDTVPTNTPSTLTFTIDNTASTLDDNALDFTDTLPAGLLVATPANVVNTCTGGTVTAVAGSGTVSYTGGTVAAGATCTLSVDVVAPAAGSFVNTSGDLTSAFGNSGTATDTLSAVPPAAFAKAFAPDTVAPDAPSTLTLTIDNSGSTLAATGLDVTDTFPANLVVATPPNASTTCTGGTLTATAGAGSVAYTGGTLAAGATCTVEVDVSSGTPGSYVNLTGNLTSSLGDSGTATDTLIVVGPTGFTKAFDPTVVGPDVPSTLTLTIDNSTGAIAATGIDVTDTFPAGLLVADVPNASTTCTGGTLTAAANTDTVTYTGGSVAAGATCTVEVDVAAAAVGMFVNLTGNLTTSLGDSGTATATLTVTGAPLFTKAFDPADVVPGETSTLIFTIDNSTGPVDATDLAFVDDLPTGMQVASPSNLTNDCVGGVVMADPGDVTVSYADGTVPAGQICMISVDVVVDGSGTFTNTAGELTSSLGSSGEGSASDTLTVLFGIEVPTLSAVGLAALAAVIGLLAVVFLRRRAGV